MAEMNTAKRSYLAIALSIVIPGMGQLYLRKPLEGLMLFFGVVFGGFLIYIHSYPVTGWRDLTYIEELEKWWSAQFAEKSLSIDSENGASATSPRRSPEPVLLYDFKNGTKLMFRPTWHFKVSGLIQALVCWIYAIYDGWEGYRGFSKRAFKNKLKTAQRRREAEKRVALMIAPKRNLEKRFDHITTTHQ